MSLPDTLRATRLEASPHSTRPALRWLGLLLVAAVAGWAMSHVGVLSAWPENWVIPIAPWLTAGIDWLAREAGIGGVTLRDVMRGLREVLSWPLDLTNGLLFAGFKAAGLPPLPWILVVGAVTIVGHSLGGWRLALLCALSLFYLAIFGLWQDAMRTLSIVLVTVPLAALLGLWLGIWVFRHPRAEGVLSALLDLMQATPHLAYLSPVVVFFGFGPVPAVIASAIFALPPMVRCVILGLRTVPPEVAEAGVMAGCSRRQLLWRVLLPASLPALLVGLNQVVMQTLAMAVIASLVGATGLGHRLLTALQQLQMGKALESGVAIVLIAIVLDRLTRAWASKADDLHSVSGTALQRHAHLIAVAAFAVLSIGLAALVPALSVLPKNLTLTTAPFWDHGVRWVSLTFAAPLSAIRDFITLYILIPLRDTFLALPWPLAIAALALGSWRLGGASLALGNLLMVGAILIVGLWTPAILTFYLASLAVLICMAIGVPLGVAAARHPRTGRVILGVCDVLQTFPSFIYLIPVIMLFRVGDLASLIAIIGYAMVPAIRFTHLGMTGVPATVIEATTALGTTRRQRFWQVELPLATPAILLGLNQTILMALAMTAITALIGSRDLGQEILKSLPEIDTGRGMMAGLAIAFIGIVANRLVEAWRLRILSRHG